MLLKSSDDYILERRFFRRRLLFWRFAAFLFLLVAALFASSRFFDDQSFLNISPYIARFSIEGVITGDRETLKLIRDLEDSPASAVLVSIESPGGTTTGAERIYDALRHLSSKKPTVAVVGTLAASGGYIAALGTDQIVAQGNSLVGSIGVLVQYPNFAKFLDMVGVKIEDVKSSPLKAAPNGFEPTSPEARAALASLVDDSYVWFKSLVKERRSLNDQDIAIVSDGRVFTGRQALKLRLIDQLGDEQTAIDWLVASKGVQKGLPVKDWKRGRSLERLGILGFSASLADLFGLSRVSDFFKSMSGYSNGYSLDGLLSIWHFDQTK